MKKTKTLLLLDVQNLWNNAYIQFGSRLRLDFKKIIDKFKCDDVSVYAFVKEFPNKRQDSLLNKLRSLNVNIVSYSDEPDIETLFKNNIDSFDSFALGSGSITHIPIIAEANRLNKKTSVVSCAEGLDKSLANEADKVLLITKKETFQL